MSGATYEHSVENPIINSPFREPTRHWLVRPDQRPVLKDERRIAGFYQREMEGHARFNIHNLASDIYDAGDGSGLIEFKIVTAIREALARWRESGYTGATPITRELFAYWSSEHRHFGKRLFFAQIEAAETIIFLNEAPEEFQRGVADRIPFDMPSDASIEAGVMAFRRYACKMATGSGKTAVMGMLAAWSILNAKQRPTDERFSDKVLVVCPNVTIRKRLQEMDPGYGKGNIYHVRKLVPKKHMKDLAGGSVMITNWHHLALKLSDGGVPGGDTHKVVKVGSYNERTDRWEESTEAWINRIEKLGKGSCRSSKWLVFNDEAHHAYRRNDAEKETSEIGDARIENEFRRQATIWIEGLDRINMQAGITMCVDMSATPFYLSNSGNDVGRPFPWIVSDFSLLDAIESGMTKIPQLPSHDQTGALDAAYFNIWRWVQERAVADGHGEKISKKPDLVAEYASQPITMLAGEWKKTFDEWQDASKKSGEEFVPPILIVVCGNVDIAEAVHKWISDNDALPWFRNERGKEVTVRIDSSRLKEIDEGTGSDLSKRLRHTLDTAGKKDWPGGKVPDEWCDLVARHNREAMSNSSLHRLSESPPPGKDVRCIVSVSMLTEGWDANTVTHIVGLRPFSSQLLCEQVTGRALRRKSYAFNDEGMLAEEIATICGVPFELVPFKTSPPPDTRLTPPPLHLIEAEDEKREFRIEIPVVDGRTIAKNLEFEIDWAQVHQVTIDPATIPSEVDFHPNLAHEGSLAKDSPGKKERISLDRWRSMHRKQSIAFILAHRVCDKWRHAMMDEDLAAPLHVLFPQVAQAAIRFLDEKVVVRGNGDSRDILASESYASKAVQSIFTAMRNGTSGSELQEKAKVVKTLKTDDVKFKTPKNVWAPIHKCHLNKMPADTEKWEQCAAYYLDSHPRVARWVKADGTEFGDGGIFEIEYYFGNDRARSYRPDFVAVTECGLHLVVEIKGAAIDADITDAKAKAAEHWAKMLTAEGNHGRWEYLLVGNPHDLPSRINKILD